MTSFKQWQANRNNARKSTGPTTEEGKNNSRCNAVRHGLTAETVIGALEDAEDYRAFEAAIIADYDAQSAVERELVLRLASLLWRLRRATKVETGLFEIEASDLTRACADRAASIQRRERLSMPCSAEKTRQASIAIRLQAAFPPQQMLWQSPIRTMLASSAQPRDRPCALFFAFGRSPQLCLGPPQSLRTDAVASGRPDSYCARWIGSPQTARKNASLVFRSPAILEDQQPNTE